MPSILISILNMSIAGSVVIILALIERFFLKSLSKKYTYVLWGIVCLRLTLPFGINFAEILNILQGKETGSIISFTEYIPQSIGTFLISHENTFSGAMTLIFTFFFVIWFIGFMCIIIYEIVSYNSVRKRLITAIKIQDQVFETDQISTPFIFGLVNPKIYVPLGIGTKELQYILCHEFIHIKNKDYIVKFCECFVLALHWFNPFVWLAFKYMNIDMEMSCDEKVVDCLGDSIRKEYAKVIFDFSKIKGKVTKSMLTFGSSDTRMRVNNVLNKRKNTLFKIIATVIVCTILTILLTFNSTIGSIFSIIHNSIYKWEVQKLETTDLSNIAIDQIQIGSDVNEIDLSIYPADRANTLGDYNYFFNQIRIGVDSENKVHSFSASNGIGILSINGCTTISTIEDITELLGQNYLDKSQDREQQLRKYIYYDSKTDIVAEFIYSNYDGYIAWVTLWKVG